MSGLPCSFECLYKMLLVENHMRNALSTYALVFDATMHFTSLEDPVEGETTVLDGRNGTKPNLTVA